MVISSLMIGLMISSLYIEFKDFEYDPVQFLKQFAHRS